MKSLVETTEELSHTREQVDIESRFVRQDALTGVRNRNAYEEEVKHLTWKSIDWNRKFGFAVVDLNFLKRINDTYGHEFGNIAIKKCCRLVCSVFAHSPVFRIGGDEFAVVLEGEDYENAEALAEKFQEEVENRTGDPWQRFSAAIGYALYDPEKDDCVNNVFMRADKAMYKNKKEMKAERR